MELVRFDESSIVRKVTSAIDDAGGRDYVQRIVLTEGEYQQLLDECRSSADDDRDVIHIKSVPLWVGDESIEARARRTSMSMLEGLLGNGTQTSKAKAKVLSLVQDEPNE